MKITKSGLALFLVSAALILIAAYPAAVNIFSNKIILGDNNCDFSGNIWLINRYQEFRSAAPYENNFFFSRLICYPFGFDIRNMLNIFPAILFSFIINFSHFIITANLLIILIFAFNYAAMYLLARQVLARSGLPVLAAFAYCTSYHIYVLLNSGKLEKLLLGFGPLAIIFLMKLIDGSALLKHRIFAGIFTGLAFLSDYHSIYFLSIFALAYIIYQKLVSGTWAGIKNLAVSGAIILLLVVVMSLPLITIFFEAYTADIVKQKDIYLLNKDPLGHNISDIFLKYELRLPFTLLAIVLSSAFLIKRMDKKSFFWLAAMLLFWMLSLGNFIYLPVFLQKAGFKQLLMPLYYMRKYLPGMARLSGSERIAFYVYICGAVYTVFVMDALFGYIRTAKARYTLLAAVCLLIIAELFLLARDYPIKSYAFSVPPFYRADNPDKGAYLHLPVFAADKTQIMYQVWHKKPICGYELGLENEYVIDPKLLKLFRGNLFIQDLMYLNYNLPVGRFTAADRRFQIQELRSYKITHILLHKNYSPVSVDTFLFFLNRDHFKSLYPYTMPEKVVILNSQSAISRHIEFLKRHFGEPEYTDDNMMAFRIGAASSYHDPL